MEIIGLTEFELRQIHQLKVMLDRCLDLSKIPPQELSKAGKAFDWFQAVAKVCAENFAKAQASEAEKAGEAQASPAPSESAPGQFPPGVKIKAFHPGTPTKGKASKAKKK